MGKPQTPQETADPNQLLDIGQAASLLNVSEASLRRWTNSGRLPCLRVGRRRERRFRRGDLLAFLEDQPSDISADAGDARPVKHGQLSAGQVTVTHRGHLCGLYDSDLGRLALAVPFLLDGLNEGSVCVLVAPSRARTAILESMMKKRTSLQADLDAGRLFVAAYHATSRGQYTYFRRIIEESVSEGAQSFRVLGDLWGMRKKATAATLAQYEADYDLHIARKYPVVTICLYDVRRYSGVEILTALKGHPDTFRYPMEQALA